MAIGNLTTATQTGLQGVQNGLRKVEQAATDIARNGTLEETDAVQLAESVVDLKQGEIQVKAAAAVIETENEVLGTLLDTKA